MAKSLSPPFEVGNIWSSSIFNSGNNRGVYRFTKEQIAKFYEVDTRTIERYLESNIDEISNNGYEVLRGKRLKELKITIKNSDDTDIDVGNKTVQLGLFNFKSLLNIGMLLTESKRAELLRKAVLDIVIDVIKSNSL